MKSKAKAMTTTLLPNFHDLRMRLTAIVLFSIAIAVAPTVFAVQLNPDGQGQVLIYPYYTARSTASGNPYVTALSLTNTSGNPKAIKVRFREGKAGAEVAAFNLFLDARDSWSGGVVGAGAAAALATTDRSCTTPLFSSSLLFSSSGYIGDGLGDSLDRTYEGYIEVFEMATVDPSSPLGRSIVHSIGVGTPNAAAPSCKDLPLTDVTPIGLSKPTGGLVGTASFINVNEGIDMSVKATALSGWSDRIQWSGVGSSAPNLATVSPTVSAVVENRESGDVLYLTRWDSGRDAVTAVLMALHVSNEYTVEPSIKAATDWILTMPTKPYYVDAARSDPPFGPRIPANSTFAFHCEPVLSATHVYCDREGQCGQGIVIDWFSGPSQSYSICGVASALTFTINGGNAIRSNLLQSSNVNNVGLVTNTVNGWLPFRPKGATQSPAGKLKAPLARTTAINLMSGSATSNLDATYLGLPIIGFAGSAYSTTGLPGVSPTILSNYGGQAVLRRSLMIEVAP